MAKIILNKDYGGFLASYKAHQMYAKRKLGIDKIYIYKFYVDEVKDESGYFVKYKHYYKKEDADQGIFNCYVLKDLGDVVQTLDTEYILCLDGNYREDPILISLVEELGDEVNSSFSSLKVVEIPDELIGNYMIDDYDGWETLHQKVVEY